MTADARAVDAALDAVLVDFDRLLQLVEDGGLQQLDDQQFIRFLQGYERIRNRIRFVERQAQLAAARATTAQASAYFGTRPSSEPLSSS
jgi:hypothetical protein